MDSFGLPNLLFNYKYYRKYFELKNNIEFLYVSIDDIYENIIISNKLFAILCISDFYNDKEFKDLSIGDKLFTHRRATEYVFKILFNDSVIYYNCKNYESNILIKIPNTQDAINKAKEICLEIGLCCIFYNTIPTKNFTPINLNKKETDDNPFKFINLIKDDYGADAIKWNIDCDKLYFNMFKNKYWIDNNFYEDIENIGINLRKFFKFKWYKLLFPLAVYNNSINVPFMNKYIWNQVNDIFKLKLDLNIIYRCLKIHPLQLAGVTNNIVFRKKIKGNEDWLHNFTEISCNSAKEFTKQYKNDIIAEIYRLLLFNYNYIGFNRFEKFMRYPLVYIDVETLEVNNFPYNLYAFDGILATYLNKDKEEIWKYSLSNYETIGNDKRDFIKRYLKVIMQ